MTDADKASLTERLKKGIASAASRGLAVWGYHLDGDRLDLWTHPAERKRRVSESGKPSVATTRTIHRGVQGSLL